MTGIAENVFRLLVFPGLVFTLVIGMFGCWVLRKVSALIQWRVGPPWYQPWVDVLKLAGKELLIPEQANAVVFLAAPVVGLAAAVLVSTVLWNALLGRHAYVGDLIVVLYLSVIPSLALIMGSSASASPHAAIGASREMKLILSYELPMAAAMVVALIKAAASGSPSGQVLDLSSLSAAKVIWSISGFMAFLVSLLCIHAKLGLVPFDIAESETELAGGILIEYSGILMGIWRLVQAVLLVALPLLLIAVFLGGFGTGRWAILAGFGKLVLLWVLLILIKNTNPRVRIDQAMRFFWFVCTPALVIAVILAILGRFYGIGWL